MMSAALFQAWRERIANAMSCRLLPIWSPATYQETLALCGPVRSAVQVPRRAIVKAMKGREVVHRVGKRRWSRIVVRCQEVMK